MSYSIASKMKVPLDCYRSKNKEPNCLIVIHFKINEIFKLSIPRMKDFIVRERRRSRVTELDKVIGLATDMLLPSYSFTTANRSASEEFDDYALREIALVYSC